MSGYSFERACAELDWLLDDDRWKGVGAGYDDINAFLATMNFSDLRPALDQRKKLAKRLAALQASQRATGRLLGVGEQTVARDLGKDRGAPSGARASTSTPDDAAPPAPSGAPWFETDVDPSTEAKRVARREAKPAVRAAHLAAARWPEGKHGVLLADPPWQPDAGLLDPTRQIENQYPTLTLAELVALAPQVAALIADDCVLLLWTTTQKLAEAVALIDAWGFVVKSGAVWVKPSVGMGYWFRGRHELLVLGTRGTPRTPLEGDRADSVITAARRGHSEKPDEVYTLIEQMFPGIPKVEIFSRARRPGWSHATNELTLRSA